MPKVKLDSVTCLTVTCTNPRSKTDYWDTAIPGFVLEVRPSGGKTFHLRYTDEGGRQRQHKIGGYHEISVDKARKMAARLRSEVVLGGDPAGKKREKKAIPFYSELADQHLAYATSYLRRPGNTEAILRIHLLPRWGRLRLDEISTQDIAKWFAEKLESGLAPSTVEKIRVVFNRSFELAAKFNLPGSHYNPVRHAPRRKFNNARERYLTTAEASRLRKAVEHSVNPMLKYIVGLLLATGARRRELLDAKWQDVHLDRRALYLPQTKTVPRYVPLSQAAIDLINEIPRFDDCPYLVPNPKTRKPFSTIKRVWDTARKEAGLSDLRLHDLRHSAASFMINAGVDLYAVGRVLGHADHQSTQRYSHLANDTLLKAVEAGSAYMNNAELKASLQVIGGDHGL